jgi:hypothetical protein
MGGRTGGGGYFQKNRLNTNLRLLFWKILEKVA